MPPLHPVPHPPAFFGGRVVAAAFVLALFGWGVGVYGPPVFLHAVVERTGWPLTQVSAAVTLHFLAGAVVVSMLPRLHRRVGVAVSIVGGAAVTTVGLFGWALAAQPWQLFAAALLSGMGWVTMGAVAVNAVVSPWFERTRPLALSRAYNGASAGGVLFAPLWALLLTVLGFAGAVAVIGAAMLGVLGLLAQAVYRHTPERLGQRPDGDAADAPAAAVSARPRLPGALLWRDRAFGTLALGMALGLFAQIGLLAHLFALIAPSLGPRAAGLVIGAATALAIAGRTLAVRLIARGTDRRRAAALSYALQALASVLLMLVDGSQTTLLLLAVALFGAGIGNATSLPPLIAQADFAPLDVARVVALIVALAQGFYAFAPAVFALLLSVTDGGAGAAGIGSRSLPLFAAAATIQLLAAALLLAGRRRA